MPAIRTRPENLPTGLLLAGAGGFLDGYTFVGRGGVFANAQTGNIVLLAVAAGARHWSAALLHVPPILAFMLGAALAETLARPTGRRIVLRPARFVLVAEIVVLLIVGALPPQVPDQVVTTAIAFTSALAIAWVTARPGVSSTILGARTTSQLDANLRASGLRLTPAETTALDAASDPHPGDYPYGRTRRRPAHPHPAARPLKTRITSGCP